MKAEINKWVLRCDLKAVRESKALMFSGSLFQSRGPSEEKARSPILVNFVRGTARRFEFPDLSVLDVK